LPDLATALLTVFVAALVTAFLAVFLAAFLPSLAFELVNGAPFVLARLIAHSQVAGKRRHQMRGSCAFSEGGCAICLAS
jgi:TctA family transporter